MNRPLVEKELLLFDQIRAVEIFAGPHKTLNRRGDIAGSLHIIIVILVFSELLNLSHFASPDIEDLSC